MHTARVEDGQRRVAADQWDIDGWQMLATEAEKASFADAKPIYERLVTQFPPIGRFWKSYAEHLAKDVSTDPEHVVALYERGVREAPTSIDLWRSYVSFSTSLAVKIPGSKLENDAIAVYEKALAATGVGLNSNPIWSHYIDFLKKHTTMLDNQRRDALRRVYHRAVISCTSFLPYSPSSQLCRNLANPCRDRIPPLFDCYKNEKRNNSPLESCYRLHRHCLLKHALLSK